ncbi:hypothetical protein PACTADRAFT_80101 [Pachysolen tannophilus NRRL Y-2460]|uniref:carnosine N-methyltransferase n=1 Tax=Pachysolen tannophilus NRRL Y-2460 TaxID=669874 RepID=A0A1E4TWB4_PACTA|nr:hypothetical protein PACTADRAFT_80101 [Pachysolen tannophilus NRRL Y-2460]
MAQQTADDIEEYNALTSVLSSFYEYGNWARRTFLIPRRLKWESLSREEHELLPWFEDHLNYLENCILQNEIFTKNLATTIAGNWQVSTDPTSWHNCKVSDLDKVKSVLNQFVREWSEEGIEERDVSFNKILKECVALYPDLQQRPNLKVLVPGAGLGRLVFEFVKLGFQTQGNEFSYHMLLASNFILNHSYVAHHHNIYPHIHKFSNHAKRINQIRPVSIPDSDPHDINRMSNEGSGIQYDELMSMCAGSFIDLYGPSNLNISETYSGDKSAADFRKLNENNFQIIATCFFLDTATNIIDYLKTIHHSLDPQGYWINFGPFLWHFEDDDSITNEVNKDNQMKPTPLKGLELTREDLIELVKKCGFKFLKYENNIETTYASSKDSLGGYRYECDYWLCQKV